MVTRYLFDENLRGELWNAMLVQNVLSAHPIDVLRVGDMSDRPLMSPDPAILIWAEREARILITKDKKTIPRHLRNHLQAGRHCPGIFIVRQKCIVPAVIDFLAMADFASHPSEWVDLITFIP